MRLLDANILLYAAFDSYSRHEKTKKWLDERLGNADEPLGIPWETALAFVRIASNPRIFQPCIGVDVAWAQIKFWLSCPAVWVPTPTKMHKQQLDALLSRKDLNSKLVADAHLAALAIEHGLILVSADLDFQRFKDLRTEDPTV